MQERCETCKFWRLLGLAKSRHYSIGICQRYAPRPIMGEPPQGDSEVRQSTFWPETDSDEWCGEYQAKSVSEGD